MTINECLESIQNLTRQNMKLLDTINKAFTTKREHLVVNINDTQYVIPSFISLENKINSLQQNLENIVNAPATGEVFTYFDGTTQRIELGGYSCSPNRVEPTTDHSFGVTANDIFKDFLNPLPYTRMSMQSLPNNIKNVSVKKVALKNQDLIDRVKAVIGYQEATEETPEDITKQISYADLVKVLYLYEEDKDYVDYDTLMRIPLRGQNATGNYTINTVNSNWHDKNFVEYYNITVDQPLTYTINDGTIERNMQVGDKLVTMNDKIIMEIIEVQPLTNTMTVQILYGGYVDLTTSVQSQQLGQLKFYASVDFDNTKYVDVPLEEDQYICVFVSAINDTTNVRSAWGTGMFYNTYALTKDEVTFKDYYKNVNNIGDTLYDITKLMNSAMYNITAEEMDRIVSYKPAIDSEDLTVTQINKHLNDSETVQNIRNLYAQKNKYKTELDTVQISIDNVNAILSDLNFSNSDNNRAIYESQLSDLNTKKAELTASILSITNEINNNVNNADTPIENAKYHIRGFLSTDIPEDIKALETSFDVIKIDVEYRYKNRNRTTGNAEVLGEDSIYSDWNKMQSIYRDKDMVRNDDDTLKYPYQFEYEETNDNLNVISFNQVDIPITQGEVVDIRYRYEYSLGHPFVRIYSDWSDIYTQTFPEEYLQDVAILTIVEENNDDIKKNAINQLLEQKGLIAHEEDKLVDQNITYFHKPEHIASGFYTDERRVIPLYDVLQSLYGRVQELETEVLGGISNSLVVTLYDDLSNMTLQRDKLNEFTTWSYTSNTNKKPLGEILTGEHSGSVYDKEIAYSQLMLNLYNDGDYNMKLYTLFPGSNTDPLTVNSPSKFNPEEYVYEGVLVSNNNGVYIQSTDTDKHIQYLNQILYFRVKDNMTNEDLYTYNTNNYTDDYLGTNSIQKSIGGANILPTASDALFAQVTDGDCLKNLSVLYPYIGDTNTLSIENGSNFIVLQPGDSIDIPLSFYYYVSSTGANSKTSQTLEFDIRTSLFTDPDTYKFKVTANFMDTFALQGIKKVNPLGAQSTTRMLKGQQKISKANTIVTNDGRIKVIKK